MPSDRTTVTELGTALGMLGTPDIDVAVRSRTPVMHSLSPEDWDRLVAAQVDAIITDDPAALLERLGRR